MRIRGEESRSKLRLKRNSAERKVIKDVKKINKSCGNLLALNEDKKDDVPRVSRQEREKIAAPARGAKRIQQEKAEQVDKKLDDKIELCLRIMKKEATDKSKARNIRVVQFTPKKSTEVTINTDKEIANSNNRFCGPFEQSRIINSGRERIRIQQAPKETKLPRKLDLKKYSDIKRAPRDLGESRKIQPNIIKDQPFSDDRLDIDNMTYEQLLALGDKIGRVSKGLSDSQIEVSFSIPLVNTSTSLCQNTKRSGCHVCKKLKVGVRCVRAVLTWTRRCKCCRVTTCFMWSALSRGLRVTNCAPFVGLMLFLNGGATNRLILTPVSYTHLTLPTICSV
eukprot:TRINITY_DN3480_c0_g2_i1.p1 TRINITY_DN3480_c0_g2~~TRINITY_DN3480_c0_g2_i1.p1  ORF type:complete len:337 (+),score=1.60 TRINITY_DN3480_c0_g2_i1:340-1350(+)